MGVNPCWQQFMTSACIAVLALFVISCENKNGSSYDAGKDTSMSGPVPGTWVIISAGTFTMGSPTYESCRDDDEDLHQVTLRRDFEIQTTEVTQEQFKEITGHNPSVFSGSIYAPVENVTWNQAASYCNTLSSRKQLTQCYSCTGDWKSIKCTVASGIWIYDCPGYRLPTEAEWEWAYRRKSTTPYYNGSNDSQKCISFDYKDINADAIGWYAYNSKSRTRPVGLKLKNHWGLYDMAGNVNEWCNDWYQKHLGYGQQTDPTGPASGKIHVQRGGDRNNPASWLRGAHRTDSGLYVGFRCIRTLKYSM